MTKLLPLFPLHTLLIPQQRFDLQIFEPRYVQLIKDCLANDLPFGVVLIREGEEVVRTSADIPQVFAVGVSAKIVDWGQTSSDLLAVTIEGQDKFRLCSSEVQDDRLMVSEVDWLAPESSLPIPEHLATLHELLQQLRNHPAVARLQLPDVDDACQLGWQLSQLLPLPNPLKVDLLAMSEPLQRLERLLPLIEDLAEGR